MDKIDKLNDPLERVISSEVELLAETWILREAYHLNYLEIEKQIKKFLRIENNFRISHSRYLSDEDEKMLNRLETDRRFYMQEIEKKSVLLQNTHFNPTDMDKRIMRFVAFANTSKAGPHNSKIIKFGKPTYKEGNQRKESFLGFKRFAQALSDLKKILYKPKSEEYSRLYVKAANEAIAFMRANYIVQNDYNDVNRHSVIFKDTIFTIKKDRKNIVHYLVRFADVDCDIARFWQYGFAPWFYDLLTIRPSKVGVPFTQAKTKEPVKESVID